MSNRNLSESLAQYSVKSFATFLAEADQMTAPTDAMGGQGGNGGPVAIKGGIPGLSDARSDDINSYYSCISDASCGPDDLSSFLENHWNMFGGEGLGQILGGWGEAGGGGAQPIGPQIGAGGAPGAGRGAGRGAQPLGPQIATGRAPGAVGGGGGPVVGKKDRLSTFRR